tara:strand:+ start:6837 stop:7685 length:849 start_codon:yes stop_codon:yes gene_type:complete
MKLENTIKEAAKKLKNHNIASYDLDAEIIIANILKIEREYLITMGYKDISNEILKKYQGHVKRRISREPIAYITGKKEFWSKNFLVNRSTLIPRPETELLIYFVVDYFKNKKINILDIGTGSGCILLSILKELTMSYGIGIDISNKAIQMAKKNSYHLGLLDRSKFKVFDLNKFNIGKYDLIVSNPPYIPSREINKLSKDIINYEPRVALNGGADGIDLIKKVIYKSNQLLKINGLFALEIGFNQYKKVSRILRYYKFREVRKEFDNNSNVRCIISTKDGFF